METLKKQGKFALKSVTILGLIVLLVNYFAPDIPAAAVENVVTEVANILGAAMVLFGRWRKGDLTINPKG